MAAISGIEAIGAPHTVPSHQQKGAQAAIDFGGAVTHRQLVLEELRVDPAALAQKKRARDSVTAQDPPADEESARAERFAMDDAARDAPEPAPSSKGQYVDVKV